MGGCVSFQLKGDKMMKGHQISKPQFGITCWKIREREKENETKWILCCHSMSKGINVLVKLVYGKKL